MAYQKLNWLNKGETGAIPINKTNLNHMDDGIVESNLFRNLFNKNDIVNGWLNYSNNVLTDITSTTFMTSGYIEVKPNTQYTINLVDATNLSGGGIMQYDSNFNWIQPGIPETQVVMTFTTTSTTKYVRFVLRNDAKDNIQFEENTEATEYTPFAGYIVESGSNDNGSWVKFSDGTMICNGKTDKSLFDGNDQSYYTEVQGIKIYRSNDPWVNFPLSFADNKVTLSLSVENTGVGCRLQIPRIADINTNSFHIQLLALEDFYNNGLAMQSILYVHWQAIGRWK